MRLASTLVIALMLLSVVPLQPGMGAPGDKINLTTPDGGETYVGGQTVSIVWTTTASGGFIHVGYSTDGGATYTDIDVVDNTGTIKPVFKWMVPFNTESATCRVKVVWTDGLGKGATVWDEDESAADFRIAEDHWVEFVDVPSEMTHGRYYPVEWVVYDPEGVVESQDLEVRVDDGSGWEAWTSLGARYEDIEPRWNFIYLTPPEYQDATGQLRIRIKDSGGLVLREAVSAEFTITSAVVTLVYPNGGEALIAGETVTVTWRVVRDPGELITGVALYYTTDDGASWPAITMSTENDYEHDWAVPTGGTSDRVRVKIELYYEEFSVLGEDESDANLRIIEDANTLSCTLIDPNPPATGAFMMGGDRHTVTWEATGSASEITGFELYYSTNSGAGWNRVDQVANTARSFSWLVPSIDTTTARFRVALTTAEGRISAISNNDFIIYTDAAFNVPPIADAGEDQRALEGARVDLDGTGSFDPNGDTLSYFWSVVDDHGYNLTIQDNATANPWFTVFVDDFCITFVIQLEVGDGGDEWPDWLYYTDRVTVTIEPSAPAILNFTPLTGWAGTELSVEVENAEGATIYFQDVAMYTMARNATGRRWVTFPIHASVPVGAASIEVRNSAGSDFTANEFEVHPAPEWLWEHAFPWHNQADHFLSYPWDFTAARGNYRTTFGDVIYIPIWICIGVPWYDPWNGLVCLGYEIEAPSGIPDPLAALYYGSFYCWIGRMGECFGLSTAVLQFYHGDLSIEDFNATATRINQLNHTTDGTIDHWQESMQGSQLSLEVLDHYLYEFMHGLELSNYGVINTGMGRFLRNVEEAVESGDLGIITMCHGGSGHAVVPYHIEEPDDRHVRIYVYDPNREFFSWENETRMLYSDDSNNHPPYIEIEKSRPYWRWRFMWPDNTTWSDTVGIVFAPYDLVNGPRTLPTDWEGLISFLAGDVSSTVEDSSGRTMRWASDGTVDANIPGMAPLPNFGGLGDDPHGWFGENVTDLLTTVTGNRDGGVYNWTLFANRSAAYGLELADIGDGSSDSLDLEFKDGMPLRGRLTYGTTDASKGYNYVHVKRMGDPASDEGRVRQRVYRVLDATLHVDSTAIMNTTDDYRSLVFENQGPHTITIGVEFQTNVMSSDSYNASGMPDHLPTARQLAIEVGPYEVVTFTPTDWLDLDNAEILIDREVPDARPPGEPSRLIGKSAGGIVKLTWNPPEDDGGAPITEYILFRGPTIAEMNQYRTIDPSEDPIYDRAVLINETYFYALAAVNRAGVGPLTPAVGVWVVQGATTSDPPTNLTAVVSGGEVLLDWDPPIFDGGRPVEGYMVYRSEDGTMTTPPLLEDVGMALEFVDKSVDEDTTYFYWVACRTAWGDSNILGPVEVYVPEGSGGNGGDGDGSDGDDGEAFPLADLAVGGVLLFAAASGGILLGRRFGRKGV